MTSKTRILVVDDSAYARRILTAMLVEEGYEVSEASSGMSALESYFLSRPDVVLLDLTMGDMSGVDVLTRLMEMNSDARVIVISADVQTTTESVVKAAGAYAFLGKPATRPNILATIENALGAQ